MLALVLAFLTPATGSLLTPVTQAVTNPGFPACVARTTPPPVGLQLLGQSASARTTDLTFQSSAMGAIEHVDVTLPTPYNPATRRYPVLYLLAGWLGDHTNYFTRGIEDLVGNLQVIVVTPDAGSSGAYTDWFGQTAVVGPSTPPPAWETFHISELIPWIDAHYPTVATAGGRAVAGLSMGGLGAMKYAASHPALFGAAGTFSGDVDINLTWPLVPATQEALWTTSLVPGLGPPAFCTWGDPVLQHDVWLRNDPTAQAAHLRGVALFLASGNGQVGPYDNPADLSWAATGATEASIWSENQAFAQALSSAGVAHTDYFYGNGTHSWPYWIADLKVFLPWLTTHLPALASS
jgi:S-formylglutathione hydrolase FrmB